MHISCHKDINRRLCPPSISVEHMILPICTNSQTKQNCKIHGAKRKRAHAYGNFSCFSHCVCVLDRGFLGLAQPQHCIWDERVLLVYVYCRKTVAAHNSKSNKSSHRLELSKFISSPFLSYYLLWISRNYVIYPSPHVVFVLDGVKRQPLELLITKCSTRMRCCRMQKHWSTSDGCVAPLARIPHICMHTAYAYTKNSQSHKFRSPAENVSVVAGEGVGVTRHKRERRWCTSAPNEHHTIHLWHLHLNEYEYCMRCI